jgi:serine acetyltransferase
MLARTLFQDWALNHHDLRIQIVLAGFRLAQWVNTGTGMRRLLRPYSLIYRLAAAWLFHMELNGDLQVGQRLRIYHGYGLVIHPQTRIGNDVTLRHGVTLGNKNYVPEAPVLEDGVDVGAHAQIIGPITIGTRAVIGAGAVVVENVPPGAVVAGNPARIVKQNPL